MPRPSPWVVDGLVAGAVAGLASSLPSALAGVRSGDDPWASTRAAGNLVLPATTPGPVLLGVGVALSVADALNWGVVLARWLDRTHPVVHGAGAGVALAAFRYGLVGRRHPLVRALPPAPQVVDSVVFGVVAGGVLWRRRRPPYHRPPLPQSPLPQSPLPPPNGVPRRDTPGRWASDAPAAARVLGPLTLTLPVLHRGASWPVLLRLAGALGRGGHVGLGAVLGPTPLVGLAGGQAQVTGPSALGLVVALVCLVPRRAWRVGRLAVTTVHESGHAIAAVLCGRRITAVHLRADASGLTLHRGPNRWGAHVLTAAAGYPAPGLVGLAGAWMIARHHPRAWFLGLLVLGIVNLAWWVRNVFGMVVMVAWVGGLGWLAIDGAPALRSGVGSVAAWYLLLGGVRAANELRADRGRGGDPADLGRLLHLPPAVFRAGFLGAALVTAAGGAGLLLGIW